MREAAPGGWLLATALGFYVVAGAGLSAVGAIAQTSNQSIQVSPGHALAEKFATDTDKSAKDKAAEERRALAEAKRKAEAEKKRQAEQRRKADEAEMLKSAQHEAEARRQELEAARAAEQAIEHAREAAIKAANQARQDEENKAAETRAAETRAADVRAAEARKIEDERRLADERRALEARHIAEAKAAEAKAAEAKAAEAKAEAERRLAAEQAAETARKLATERDALEARRLADAKADEERKATEARHEEARQQALAAEREAETQRVSERLRQAREAHELRASERAGATQNSHSQSPSSSTTSVGTSVVGMPVAEPFKVGNPDRDGSSRENTTTGVGGRVAVLLLMEPGNRGIRRHNKTADPVLCAPEGCYVSNGADASAVLMQGRKALGFGRTFGERAGACSNSLGCVFRDVDLSSLPSLLQPVDMRVMRHDRREAQAIEAVSDCHVVAGRFGCRRAIHASNYVMWIVPEALAAKVGAAGLERALADGLPEMERADLPAAVLSRR